MSSLRDQILSEITKLLNEDPASERRERAELVVRSIGNKPVEDSENLALTTPDEEKAIQEILSNPQQVLELQKKYNQGIELTLLQRKVLFRYNVEKAKNPDSGPPSEAGYKQNTKAAGYIKCTDPTVVIAAQQYMKYIKKFPIKVDGKYGPETHGMFRKFSRMDKTDPLYNFSGALANPPQICEMLNIIRKSPGKMEELRTALAKIGESIGQLPKVKKVKKVKKPAAPAPTEKPNISTGSEQEQADINRKLFPSLYCDDGTLAPNGDREKCPTEPAKLEESKNWLDRTREETASNLFERLVKDASKKVI